MNNILQSLPLMLGSKPVYYLIHVTGRCNASCSHCFYWREINNDDGKGEIKLEEFEKISKEIGRLLIINLCGAEPYMRDDLCDIARIFVKNNDCRLLTIPSNGLMTDRIVNYARRLCKENPKTFFRFSFSLDGPKEIHDSIRGIPNMFDKVCRTIHEVAALHEHFSNFALIVGTIFSRRTQSHILNFLDWIEENLPVDQSNVMFVRGDPRSRRMLDVNLDIYKKVARRVMRKSANSKADRQIDALLSYSMFLNTLNTVVRAKSNLSKRAFRCFAGQKHLVIGKNADIYPCELLEKSWSMGNLRDFDYNINNLLKSPQAKKVVRWILEKHCACSWECAIQASKAFDPFQWPALIARASTLKFRQHKNKD